MRTIRISNLNPNLFAAKFDRKHLGALLFAPARTIVEADVPAVPAADHFTVLDHALAEREAQMGAKILHRVDFSFPLKQRNANAISLYGVSKAIWHQILKGCNPYPVVHVRDDILLTLNFERPS